MITEQLRNPSELDISLKMEFGPFETVHKWKRMSECYEFVGARFVIAIMYSSQHSHKITLWFSLNIVCFFRIAIIFEVSN